MQRVLCSWPRSKLNESFEMTRLKAEQESDAQYALMWDHVRLDRESNAESDIFRKQKRTTLQIQI